MFYTVRTFGAAEVPLVVTSGSASSVAAYTANSGVTWQSATLPASGNWSVGVYGGSRWVTVARNAASKISAYSLTGLTWVQGGNMPAQDFWSRLAYGNGIFVCKTETHNSPNYATSADGGETWTARATFPTPCNNGGSGQDVLWIGDRFLTFADKVCYTSTDGISWTQRGTTGAGTGPYQGTYISSTDTIIYQYATNRHYTYSTDKGVTWGTSDVYTGNSYFAVSQGTLAFFSGGADDTVHITADGITENVYTIGALLHPWTLGWSGIKLVATDASVANFSYYSEDLGQTWILGGVLPSNANWKGLTAKKELPW